ncbi:MAG: hypothetical protein A3F72_06775 [Bacteroidetes bacterium RIFCSPLOWO2_12_FULL_35_15]|nr:MAG: hypothetical protein A3F72_06775 [Bacteroidetes bacterium RIFCSPLOWO2_12_FULL_35_15]
MKIKLTVGFLITLLFFISCGHNTNTKADKNVDNIQTTDSAKIKIGREEVKVIPPINPLYDDVAKYIAGMTVQSSKVIDTALTNDPIWKEYATNFDKSWRKLDTTKIVKMKKWRDKELKELSYKTVFYPFSGADFLNGFIFFPTADKYILVGLEPVGTLPDFQKGMPKDSLAAYFQEVNRSLYAIINFSFFRTKSMKADFKNKDLNGTIHLILLFMERTGNSIVDIKPVDVNENGEISPIQNGTTVSNKGVEIDFVNSDSVLKKAYYFSVNLDNEHLNKNQNFTTFINQQNDVVTYIKSASYLMHASYFSAIRDLILNKSKYVLEDDSGIPYRYFKTDEWTPTFYGKYSGAISLFPNKFQKDLDSCYKNNTSPKPLDFGIGYKYKVGESNLLLFKKK